MSFLQFGGVSRRFGISRVLRCFGEVLRGIEGSFQLVFRLGIPARRYPWAMGEKKRTRWKMLKMFHGHH